MTEPFLGEIRCFGFTFAPQGWIMCNGQVLAISQFTALFSLLGTTYGGNGTSNFQLPDLRGRVPKHLGSGPGLSTYVEGEVGGVEQINQVVSHSHQLTANSGLGTTDSPVGAVPAGGGSYAPSTDGNVMDPTTTTGVSAIETQSPYVVMNWCMALEGIFPSRN